ncbi:hypothetical protein GOODEAATRI_029170 [Goodea atripinnis]|uniref:Uncharacterized protein n=1 Tax=Goodea atripinnis TaxID=208336 RepID=A0ABV0PI34_9TELE
MLSLSAIVFQAMLGIFFSAKSAVLIEDVPFTEEDIRNDKNPPQNIYALYNQVGINCFIAAAVYVAVGAISLCQVRLNKRQEYMDTDFTQHITKEVKIHDPSPARRTRTTIHVPSVPLSRINQLDIQI